MTRDELPTLDEEAPPPNPEAAKLRHAIRFAIDMLADGDHDVALATLRDALATST